MSRGASTTLPSVLAVLAALALGGCTGLASPPERPSPPAGTTSSTPAVTHEIPTPVPRQHALAGAPSAARAVRAFAVEYINWRADTVATQLRALARRSIGQARSMMELQAAQTAGDGELHGGGIANHGTVEAVAPLAGAPGRYAVVTRERTTATLTSAYDGLRPAWHVTVATVTEPVPGQWVLSGWQPES